MANDTFAKTIISQTMDINLSKAAGSAQQKETLSTLCTDILLIVIKMRDAEDIGDTAPLRKLIHYYIKQFEKNCAVIGIKPETVNAVKYALVAILDETVLSNKGPAREFWITSPMQLELYGDNIAGEGFYNKLDTMLQEPEKNIDALEVFYICLCLGFQGKYILGNAEEREATITKLARTLVRTGNLNIDTLSPHAIRRTVLKKVSGVEKTVRIPLWLTGSLLAAALIFGWISISYMASSKASLITEMVGK
jgi:type VI secretion system protein ImpK